MTEWLNWTEEDKASVGRDKSSSVLKAAQFASFLTLCPSGQHGLGSEVCLHFMVIWVPNSLQPHGLYSPWNSPGQNTGVGRLSLLQGIFPTWGSNPGLPYCRWILYQLSRKGSLRILDWVAYLFSSGSSNPGIEMRFPALQADSLPTELSGDDDEFQLFLLWCVFMPTHPSPCYIYSWT